MKIDNPDGGELTDRWPWSTRTVALALILGIGVYVVLGAFAFPNTDDFMHMADARKLGFVGSGLKYYEGWSGRFVSNTLLAGFYVAFDYHYWYGVLPTLMILGTVLALAMVFSVVLAQRLLTRQGLLAGGLVAFVYNTHLVSEPEAYYWFPASCTYTLSNILALICISLALYSLIKQPPKWLPPTLATLLFLITGMNETNMPVVGLLLAAYALAAWNWQRQRLPLAAVCLVVFAVGCGLSILAPGNSVRRGHFPEPNLLMAAAQTVLVGLDRIQFWLGMPVWWALAFWSGGVGAHANGSLVAAVRRKLTTRRAIYGFLAGLLLLCGYFFPAIYVTSSLPKSRMYNSFDLSFLTFSIASAALIGSLWAARRRPSPQGLGVLAWVVVACAAFSQTSLFLGVVDDLQRAPAYRQQWLAREALIAEAKAAGQTELVVPAIKDPPTSLMYIDFTNRPADNATARRFYQIKSLQSDRTNAHKPIEHLW